MNKTIIWLAGLLGPIPISRAAVNTLPAASVSADSAKFGGSFGLWNSLWMFGLTLLVYRRGARLGIKS